MYTPSKERLVEVINSLTAVVPEVHRMILKAGVAALIEERKFDPNLDLSLQGLMMGEYGFICPEGATWYIRRLARQVLEYKYSLPPSANSTCIQV